MPKIPIFEKKNVLITGGAGFIGSHICDALVKEAKVICLDNLISGSLENIEHLLRNPDFIFIKQDISEPFDLSKWPELKRFKVEFQGVQEIYHLACPTSPKDFEKYKLETIKANSVGTAQILDLASAWRAKVFYASSAVVYGNLPREISSVSENDQGELDHLSPRACYDEGKRFAETMVETYKDMHKMETRLARIFRTYGPRMRLQSGEMIPDFVVSALEDKPLTIYGNQDFNTSLCYITDIVDGILKLMNSERDPGPVNLGSDQIYNIKDVADKIIALTGSKSKIIFADPLLFMRPQPLPNIRRAKDELGWFPIVRLEDGLNRMIEYTRGQKHLLGAK